MSRISEGPTFDRDSRSVVRSLICLFAFRSNPVSKVYQHRSRNDRILEVTWSTGSLRKNCKRHCCLRVNHFRNLLKEQARIEHAPNGSLLTYISSADAPVNDHFTDNVKSKDLKVTLISLLSAVVARFADAYS